MNVVGAMALLLSGHVVRRSSWLNTNHTGDGHQVEAHLALHEYDGERGVIHSSERLVYGRKQTRGQCVFLTSDDLLAEDWEIVPSALSTETEDRRHDR